MIKPSDLPSKQPVEYFVSYAHADSTEAARLRKALEPCLQASAVHTFHHWHDEDILLGEDWNATIQRAIAECHFGLLLISPAFLSRHYIRDHELPNFVAPDAAAPAPGKIAAPVMLKPVALDGTMDLRGLVSRQIFRHEGQAFSEQRSKASQESFAQALFKQITSRLKSFPLDPTLHPNSHPAAIGVVLSLGTPTVAPDPCLGPHEGALADAGRAASSISPPIVVASPADPTDHRGYKRREREQRWKAEREKDLKEKLVTLLKSATSLMRELECEAPPRCGIEEASDLPEEARARRIFGCLMKTAPFTDALKWLSDAYNAVPQKDRDARSVLAEIAQSLIPWLYVAGCPGEFSRLEGVSLGEVVGLPIGLHCFAEIVSAGLELRAAEFVGGEKPKPRGCMSLSEPPLGGPGAEIEGHLRNELFSKLGVLAEFKNADPGKKDERINARLIDLQESERKRYYFTFFVNEYDDTSLLDRIAGRYPALAIIRLDSQWTQTHDSLWIKISRLLGYKS